MYSTVIHLQTATPLTGYAAVLTQQLINVLDHPATDLRYEIELIDSDGNVFEHVNNQARDARTTHVRRPGSRPGDKIAVDDQLPSGDAVKLAVTSGGATLTNEVPLTEARAVAVTLIAAAARSQTRADNARVPVDPGGIRPSRSQ